MAYQTGDPVTFADGRDGFEPIMYDGLYQDDFYQVNVDMQYRPPNGNWHASFYIHNLTDEEIWTSRSVSEVNDPTRAVGQGIYVTGQLQPPQTWGIRIGTEF